jgi:hypothetical protein
MCGEETHQINLRRRTEDRRPDGLAVFVFPRVPDALNTENIMNSSKIILRINAANPNHHLYNNNGTWWCHYTVYPTPFTKHRMRASLGTKDLVEARSRRDQLLFASWAFSFPEQKRS